MVGNIINACSSPSDWLASWQVLGALGIIVSWLFLSLIYMVASFLDNISLMARAKAEFWEIITTSIIFGSIMLIVGAACTFPASYINPTSGVDGNLFTTAEQYLFWLRNLTMATFKDIMSMNNTISMLLSIMGGFNVFGIGLTLQPFAGLQPLMNILNLFMTGIMICLVATVAQITVLKFIEAGALSVLLPVGIVCRAFPFTRQFGGSIIAIAIGLFVFYPFMLVVDDAIMGTPSINPNLIPELPSNGFGNTGPSFVEFFLAGAVGGTTMFNSSIDMIINYFVQKPMVEIGRVAIAAFVLPAINGVVFVSVVRGLSRALGQEVDVSSLSRIV